MTRLGCLLLAFTLALCAFFYHRHVVDGYKVELAASQKRVETLSAVVASQQDTINALQADKKKTDDILLKFGEESEQITAEKEGKRRATEKVRRTDESFVSWEAQPLPASVRVGGLLGKAGTHNGTAGGEVKAASPADVLYTRPSLEW